MSVTVTPRQIQALSGLAEIQRDRDTGRPRMVRTIIADYTAFTAKRAPVFTETLIVIPYLEKIEEAAMKRQLNDKHCGLPK